MNTDQRTALEAITNAIQNSLVKRWWHLFGINRDVLERHARTLRAMADSGVSDAVDADARDAGRYRWLRDAKCNHLYLTRDADHASNYMSAAEYIESSHGHDWMADTDPAEVQRMKDTNTIWCLQVYPTTPIGFNVWNAATLDAAIDAAIANELPSTAEKGE